MRKTVEEYKKKYDEFCEARNITGYFLTFEEWIAISWANDENTFFDKPDFVEKLLLLKKEDDEFYGLVNAGLYIMLLRVQTEPETINMFFDK